MMFEIVGARLLGPYVGTSLYVWTSLIGVMLGCMGVGYAVGGVLADKAPTHRMLGQIFLAAAIAVAYSAFLKDALPQEVGKFVTHLETKTILLSFLLFAPASVLLAMVTPFGIKLTLKDVSRVGSESGILSAASTIGSIFGTMIAGFFLIPFIGSLKTMLVVSLLSACMAFVFLLRERFTFKHIIGFLCWMILVGASMEVHALHASRLVADADTPYNRIWVYQFLDKALGKQVIGLATDPFGTQAAQLVEPSDDLYFSYTRFYRLSELLVPKAARALMIGGCAYTYPRDFLRRFPQARMDVVEIDAGMTQIARTFFGLTDHPRMQILHEDGRVFLNATSEMYDAIYVDAFNTNLNIPFQLTTKEAVSHLSRVLNEDGAVFTNLISAIDGPGSLFFQAELETYRAVFPYVAVFSVENDPRTETQNILLVASKKPLALEEASLGEAWRAYEPHLIALDSVERTVPVLTDDLAPTEYYTRQSTP